MTGFPWGALLSAGGSLLGGWMSQNQADKTNEANLQAAREFAQNRVSWTVNDAKKAGIHPLAALGAQTFNPPTFQVAGQSPMGNAIADGAKAFADAFAQEQLATQKATTEKTLAEAELARATSRTVIQKAAASETPKVGPWQTYVDPGYREILIEGKPFRVSTDSVPADEIQKEYDDWVSGLYGGAKWLRDWVNNQPDFAPVHEWTGRGNRPSFQEWSDGLRKKVWK